MKAFMDKDFLLSTETAKVIFEKLNRTIEKCRRYGIGVYVFAIEPVALARS